MREQPTGESLLQCAREVLKNNVLPLLEGDAKRDVLMVMNALGIAQRELLTGKQAEDAECQSLAGLLDEPVFDVAQANRDLAMRVRAGLADPGNEDRAAVLAHLRLVGESRLQASNPKVLVDQRTR